MDKMESNIPTHVAIVLDGNRRWAVGKGLPYIEGHKEAINRVMEIIEYAQKRGIAYLTVWAWSTKNWSRNKEFIDDIFMLLRGDLFSEKLLQKAIENGAKFSHIGKWDGFPDDIISKIKNKIKADPAEKKIDVNLAIGYEGRDELIRAVKKIINDGVSAEDVDQKLIAGYLDTAGQPDVDLLIRPGCEKRTSGYLIWQAADAEIYFSDVLMPDFDTKEFEKALTDYSKRERRMGGDSKKY